jgi:threonine dehydratase
VRFEYLAKNQRESGPAFVGLEVRAREDYAGLVVRMRDRGIDFTEVGAGDALYSFLV